jgi:signal transduction histidine kinase
MVRWELLRGVRPVDVVLAGVLGALAVCLTVANVLDTGADVRVDSHSWLSVPVFLAATLPVLWWRRGLVPVLAVACVAMAAHVLAFGSLVRCGAGLPLAFVLAFLSGTAAGRAARVLALGLTGVLAALVLVRDTAAGPELLPLVLALCLGLFGAGRVMARRAQLAGELRERNEELRRLRDERAALQVTDDRIELSARLEALLDRRLRQLAVAAAGGAGDQDPQATKALLATLEEDSRQTLGEMRELVGVLRGGEVALAPVPSVAHLEALLACHLQEGARLQVSGDPRMLPASVELSVYRIVEHLVGALAAAAPDGVVVVLRFTEGALELQVTAPVTRSADLRVAVARARERAALHAGSLDLVRTGHGRTRVVASLPALTGV